MAHTTESTQPKSLLSSKVEAANARRESLKGRGTVSILPTTYYTPTKAQVEDLLVALMAMPTGAMRSSKRRPAAMWSLSSASAI